MASYERNAMPKIAALRKNHPFRITDPVDGRRVRARFLAPPQDIEDCLASWEILETSNRERVADHATPVAIAA